MRTLLHGVRDHLKDAWTYVEVGAKPDGVPDSQGYATVWLASDPPANNTHTDGDTDVSSSPRVHVKSIGNSFDQAGFVADLLDARIRDSLAVDGLAVHLVERDGQSGPIRDDDVHPAPHSFYVDRFYRLMIAPAEDQGS